MRKERTKKPFYKRWWVWIFAIVIIGAALSGGEEDGKESAADGKDAAHVVSLPAKEPVEETEVVIEEEEPEAAEPAVEEETRTLGEKNAVASAKQYISFTAFSYSGLVKQLEFEGYSHEEAVFGVEQCGADWKEQAIKKAKDYLSFSAFSLQGLVKQLEFEGFTSEEAIIGAGNTGADWKEQAAKKAQEYLDFSSFSRSELIAQLKFEGFTDEESEYGVQAVGY